MMHTPPLKTNNVETEMHISVVLSYQTCVYFYVYKVAMQTNSWSLVAIIMTKIFTATGSFFNFRKGTQVLKEGICSGLFSAAYQNSDQYYDIGPLWPIELTSETVQFESTTIYLHV